MKFALSAISNKNERIVATRDAKGFCEICEQSLIPRCGSKRVHHWAHKAGKDCDSWRERESDWHYQWKQLVNEDFQENVVEKNGIKHRADIRLLSGIVIELQNSKLSSEDRFERELFYERMLWIINFSNVEIEIIEKCFKQNLFDDYYIQIKNKHEWIYQSPHQCPFFLDFDNNVLFQITEFTEYNHQKKRRIYGKFLSKSDFIKQYLRPIFDFDLEKIQISHHHFEDAKEQKRLSLEKERKLEERLQKRREEWQRQNEEARKKDEEDAQKQREKITFVKKTKNEYVWGVWTEQDSQAVALEEEIKKQSKKEPWED